MFRAASLILALALTSCADAPSPHPPVSSHPCGPTLTSDWFSEPAPRDWTGIELVPVKLVLEVQDTGGTAATLLARVDALLISPAQVQQFTGHPGPIPAPGTSAYLVRAVYPTQGSKVEVGWHEDDLHVFAGGLGCPRFQKRPVIVYLDRLPRNVFVSAMTAL